MARIEFQYLTGITLTYEALSADGGTVRTAAGTSLPEVGSTGYYTVVDANIVTGDVAIVRDADDVVGGGKENPPVILSSDGLDSVSTTEPSGVPSNFREQMILIYNRLFRKTTLTATQLKTFSSSGPVIVTQEVSDDGTTQTINEAT
ncbi:MAG: hypothetical protein KAS32_17145 [Candidatus Peribacteraceae bacterium]|nr:hypothetical protein [Candidatus Peribacteraceae bacterium]